MKTAFVVFALFVLAVLSSGCLGKDDSLSTGAGIITGASAGAEKIQETKKTQEEVKFSCEDGNICTSDVFNALTKQCEHSIVENCCGNSKCEINERCNEETHRTICPKDCPISCGGFLITNEKETAAIQGEFTYSCTNDNCLKRDEKDFTINEKTTDVGLKTYVINVGELAKDDITSTFFCEELDNQYATSATHDNDQINGILIRDYFNTNENSVSSLNSILYKNNFAKYVLNFDTTKIAKNTNMRCVITLQSDSLRDMQDVLIDFHMPA